MGHSGALGQEEKKEGSGNPAPEVSEENKDAIKSCSRGHLYGILVKS